MTLPKNEKIYCDANFLVAYGAKAARQPELQKKAKALFAQILVSKCILVASPLTFDEAWNAVKIEAGPKRIKHKYLYQLERKILFRIGLKLKRIDMVEYFSFADVTNDLKNITSLFLSISRFEVVQLLDNTEGIKLALSDLDKFKMRPRDSFHLAIMQTNNIKYILTRDVNDFNKEGMGVNILNF